ncbi:GntR family transcriptional regulator [Lederbergia citrea]|uniref:GntR family transcriptional regulator n=1 Tax=Lederbergia citrea TaxID=2833581 RepID=UPI001BC93162|nr:GntR family transcriptional regulator [Lederbergia citrea]MBS4177483.1 GntR family transcriptional regulator [Lederbergia citrea]
MKTNSNPSTLLKELAYKKIKEGIIEERYIPRSFLSERDLIEELNMSKTPIKAAIARLEAENFVTVSSKRGIIINDLSLEMINDIYNLRVALETFNCEQLVHRKTQNSFTELQNIIHEMDIYVDELDVKKFAEADHVFHLMISKQTGNNEINKILMNYYDHLYRITLKHLKKNPERMKKFHEEHRLILKLLENSDPSCVSIMKLHLENSKSLLYQ